MSPEPLSTIKVTVALSASKVPLVSVNHLMHLQPGERGGAEFTNVAAERKIFSVEKIMTLLPL